MEDRGRSMEDRDVLAAGVPSVSSTRAPSPLVQELAAYPNVGEALRAFSGQANVLLLESILKRGHVGQYSFLVADPFEFFELQQARHGSDPFAQIRQRFSRFAAASVEGLPPFQGGVAGLLSYELGHAWEQLPTPPFDEFRLPAMCVGLYDWVIGWDHTADRSWIISHGWPEIEATRRVDRAAKRLQWVQETLQKASGSRNAEPREKPCPVPNPEFRDAAASAPRFPAPGPKGLLSDFSRDDYLRAVQRTIEYIDAGDIFQANLSQRLLIPQHRTPIELYERLRCFNPAPFAGCFLHGDWAVVSASPERFVCVRDGEVETRPIKGTRQRRMGPEADLFTRDELRESGKDQAENVMIVDLLRNDLSRVCRPGTIRVPQLCSVETYETVQHLVSEVRGQLVADRDVWDLFAAVYPGGSVTGAPKVRAMQIIAELEPTARGPYCGSLFYAGFDGTLDSNILIRTFVCRNGWIQCPVGGGIVAQSDPAAEYEETLHKAEGMLRAL